jgi:hypothetical protein
MGRPKERNTLRLGFGGGTVQRQAGDATAFRTATAQDTLQSRAALDHAQHL